MSINDIKMNSGQAMGGMSSQEQSVDDLLNDFDKKLDRLLEDLDALEKGGQEPGKPFVLAGSNDIEMPFYRKPDSESGLSPHEMIRNAERGNRQPGAASMEMTNPARPVGGSLGSSGTNASGTKATGSRSGELITVAAPIVLDGGVHDMQGATFTAAPNMGDGGQAEDQQSIFRLENGAVLKNANIGENGADGIHIYGGGSVDNVHFQDVGEDAITVKSPGNVSISNSSFKSATDKVLQINADTNIKVDNVMADKFQTLMRTNGGDRSMNVEAEIRNSEFKNGRHVFVSDSSNVTLSMSDNKAENIETWTRQFNRKSGPEAVIGEKMKNLEWL